MLGAVNLAAANLRNRICRDVAACVHDAAAGILISELQSCPQPTSVGSFVSKNSP
jgi:hypothetical protein